jgi:hypothetical protein
MTDKTSSKDLPRDIMLCSICGYKYAIKGYECCEDCAPIAEKQAVDLANTAADFADKIAGHLRQALAEPEKYALNDAKKKEIEYTLRLIADENARTRQELKKLKK